MPAPEIKINCRDCGKLISLTWAYISDLGGYRCKDCHQGSDDAKRIEELKAKLKEILGW